MESTLKTQEDWIAELGIADDNHIHADEQTTETEGDIT